MLAKSLLISILSASSTQALALSGRATSRTCGTKSPSAEHRAISAALAAEEANGSSIQPLTTTDVDVYFHVVAASESPEDGYISVRPHRG